MKKLLACFLSIVFAVFLFSGSALAQEMSKEELAEELKALKERTRSLEEALAIPEKAETSDIIEYEDVEDLEEYIKRIEFSGAIEVEAVYEQIKPKVGEKEDSSDLTLATVDFAIDADKPLKHNNVNSCSFLTLTNALKQLHHLKFNNL